MSRRGPGPARGGASLHLYLLIDAHGVDPFQFAGPVLSFIIWDVCKHHSCDFVQVNHRKVQLSQFQDNRNHLNPPKRNLIFYLKKNVH